MATGSNQYAMMHGAPSLRVAIAEKVARLYGANYDVEREITVTAGATEAIFCAIAACVRPGDEVIVFAPVYDAYIPAILLNGGTPILAKLAAPAQCLASLASCLSVLGRPRNFPGMSLSWSSTSL